MESTIALSIAQKSVKLWRSSHQSRGRAGRSGRRAHPARLGWIVAHTTDPPTAIIYAQAPIMASPYFVWTSPDQARAAGTA